MRLYISHEKPHLVFLFVEHMSKLILNKKIDLIINGNKVTGPVTSVILEDTPHNNILVTINDKAYNIPLLEQTKARLGKEMIRVETENHSTIIEILD